MTSPVQVTLHVALKVTPPTTIRIAVTLFLLCLFAITPAFAQPSLQRLKGHVPTIVANGQAPLLSMLPASQKLHLSIVLPLRNQSALNALLKQLYDPSSPMYRQFLSTPQFTQQFGPTEKDYQAVIDFAQTNGFTVTSTPPNRLILSMDGTAQQVEQTFHVHMNVYHDAKENRPFYSVQMSGTMYATAPKYGQSQTVSMSF
uniref:Peptidase S53 activation domain-containing protein n=1 Tax=mine drainage metagenome TaxID=410659 RepID=E6PYP8_9ZZZZ